jgi:hypothetical protein
VSGLASVPKFTLSVHFVEPDGQRHSDQAECSAGGATWTVDRVHGETYEQFVERVEAEADAPDRGVHIIFWNPSRSEVAHLAEGSD